MSRIDATEKRIARRRRKLRQSKAAVRLWRGRLSRARAYLKTLKARAAARRLPTRMFDAVTPENMPGNAEAVAGYTSGNWPTFPRLAGMFPHARRVSIAVTSAHDADVLDVEPGDATPAEAPSWVKRQHARGLKRPGVYTSVSQAQDLVDLLARFGVARDQYRLWTAHYTFTPHLCDSRCGFGMRTRADATQFTDRALGRSLDESVTARSFWR